MHPHYRRNIFDDRQGYGVVSRALHWLMAGLFAWQFAGALVHLLAPQSGARQLFWPTHTTVGFSLLLLVLLRGAWGLANARRRQQQASRRLGRAALVGHLAIYALMVTVPVLALVRTYGGGRAFSYFGLTIFSATGNRVPELMAPGNALHGPLGWTLFALILGHVAMSFVHRFAWKEDVIGPMTRGRRQALAEG
ncbi:cytochrome b [Phreatobacter sp. AB_2022a]|uniref:cytochrome b n=1 Tax=Phreatobacter sp. AB_2022a TaxID=3003134 RepID=UPI0022872DB1|nr:cytochrome b [Phreatobacter sp. AB_2022a]MCZ0733263.1 cytochrome b [Phreatobacter sp. AB_2022a]